MSANRTRNDAQKMPAYKSVRRKAEVRKILVSISQTIASPPNCMDEFFLAANSELATDPAHMAFDHVCVWIESQFPHILQQHGARDDPPTVTSKVFQDLKFA